MKKEDPLDQPIASLFTPTLRLIPFYLAQKLQVITLKDLARHTPEAVLEAVGPALFVHLAQLMRKYGATFQGYAASDLLLTDQEWRGCAKAVGVDITVQAARGLLRGCIVTTAALLACTEQDLLDIRNVGPQQVKMVMELQAALRAQPTS